jgi:hypothetical protein
VAGDVGHVYGRETYMDLVDSVCKGWNHRAAVKGAGSDSQAETKCLLRVNGKCLSKDFGGQLLHGQVASGGAWVESGR